MAKLIVFAFFALALQGCAWLTTYQASLGEPTTGVSMDAKQRVILFNTVKGVRRTCAEPSPDVMSALSASGSLSLFGISKQEAFAAGFSEGTQNIGLRTTSIQLMRDSMYRACEAYLNHGISEDQYKTLQNQAQALVVGLLAIEQLTGAVKADQGSIVMGSNANGAPNADRQSELLAAAEDQKASQDVVVKSARDVKDAAEKELAIATASKKSADTANPKVQDAIDKAKTAFDVADGKSKAAAQSLDDELATQKLVDAKLARAKEGYERARTWVSSATSGEAVYAPGQRVTSAQATLALGTSVENIVKQVLQRSALDECLNFYREQDNANGNPSLARAKGADRQNQDNFCSIVLSTEKTKANAAEAEAQAKQQAQVNEMTRLRILQNTPSLLLDPEKLQQLKPK